MMCTSGRVIYCTQHLQTNDVLQGEIFPDNISSKDAHARRPHVGFRSKVAFSTGFFP